MPHLAFDPVPRSAGWHHRLDRAWLAHGGNAARLRFYRTQPAASLGRHQIAARELRLDYCAEHGIEITRRVTGGGALYLDPGQLCFSLLLPQTPLDMGSALETAARALALALAESGADAAFKFPNDVEIAGRKVASLFAAREGQALLLQGVVLLQADVRVMLETLRAPTEKLSADGLAAARDRLAPLSQWLAPMPAPELLADSMGRHLATAFGIAPRDENIAPADALPEPAPATGGLEALVKTPGGALYCHLAADAGQVRELAFSGDFHLAPSDTLDKLAAQLCGTPLAALAQTARAGLAQTAWDMPGFAAEDILHAVELAAAKHAAATALGLSPDAADTLMLFAGQAEISPLATLAQASALLLPYCAKPAWCAFRTLDDCTECGKCEVGEAYRLGRERGMDVTTIVNYEHLETTLARLKAQGAPSYVGLCCGQFFLKRHRAFQAAGLPALLLDIQGATCYELKREHEAYAGSFQAEARLDLDTLRRVMAGVPYGTVAPCDTPVIHDNPLITQHLQPGPELA